MQNIWTEIKQNLEKMLEPGIFRIWVGPLSGTVRNTEIEVSAPNSFMRDWVKNKLESQFRLAAENVLHTPANKIILRFKVQESDNAVVTPNKCGDAIQKTFAKVWQSAQLPLPLKHNVNDAVTRWHFSFDDFVVGDSNKLAVAAAKEMGTKGTVRTLFVNAAPGLGKTHLAQATGHSLSGEGTLKAAYLTAEQFASRFVHCMKEKKLEELKSYLCSLDALVLEDIHFLQRKNAMQEMVLNIVKNLQAKGGRVIFTSSFSTKELRDIDPQLVSHFCSGILTGIEKPNLQMRKEILQCKAKSYNVKLPDEVCDILSEKIITDIRQLESCLSNMIFKARLFNSGLSLELALDTVNQYAAAEATIDMQAIVRLVCESFGVTEKQLCSKSRRHEFVTGRNTAYYLARKHTDLSLEEIGCIFNRKHSTVMRGITQVEEEIARESSQGKQFARAVSMIERKCGLNT